MALEEAPKGQRWSEFEDSVMHTWQERDLVRAEIDARIQDSDLLGAGLASFEHVLHSVELGHHVDADHFMTLAIYLLREDLALANQQTRETIPEDQESFELPIWLDTEWQRESFESNWNLDERDDSASDQAQEDAQLALDWEKAYQDRKLFDYDDLKAKVEIAEAIINQGDVFTPEECNEAICSAVQACSKLVFEHGFVEGTDKYNKLKLVQLAGKLAQRLNLDDASDLSLEHVFVEQAFDALEHLTLMATVTAANTNRELIIARKGFRQILYVETDTYFGDTYPMIAGIDRVLAYKAGYFATRHVVNAAKACSPSSRRRDNPNYWDPRSSKSQQQQAQWAYDAITG